MRDRRIDGQHDRRDFGRRPQAEVHARDIAVAGPLLQQLDHAPADTDRRLRGIVSLAPRHLCRIEQQQQIDVGRIIELPASELAERDDGYAAKPGPGNALGKRRFQRPFDGLVGEIRQDPRRFLEAQLTREIAQGYRQSHPQAASPELHLHRFRACQPGRFDSFPRARRGEHFGEPWKGRRLPKEGRVLHRALQCLRTRRTASGRLTSRSSSRVCHVRRNLPAGWSFTTDHGYGVSIQWCVGYQHGPQNHPRRYSASTCGHNGRAPASFLAGRRWPVRTRLFRTPAPFELTACESPGPPGSDPQP